jgi:hypothetical protein
MKPSALLTRTLVSAVPVIAGALMLGASAAAPQSPAPAPPAQTVLPGYWEYTTSALGMGDTETKCVRPSEINRFFGGLSTRRWQCTYPVREVGNGQARFEGVCRDPKGPMTRNISVSGAGRSWRGVCPIFRPVLRRTASAPNARPMPNISEARFVGLQSKKKARSRDRAFCL